MREDRNTVKITDESQELKERTGKGNKIHPTTDPE